ILLDLCRDIWTYVSMDYFKQKLKAGEIGSSAILKGKFELNRLDYGIGGKSWTMADRVAVSINILLAPEKV
ncbi:MAG TPA: hypothetical protein PKY12_13075, partial [Catalimonadaceae bacterium]|nr:hypothetical protein [Catalimonadaceae bacterium]